MMRPLPVYCSAQASNISSLHLPPSSVKVRNVGSSNVCHVVDYCRRNVKRSGQHALKLPRQRQLDQRIEIPFAVHDLAEAAVCTRIGVDKPVAAEIREIDDLQP